MKITVSRILFRGVYDHFPILLPVFGQDEGFLFSGGENNAK